MHLSAVRLLLFLSAVSCVWGRQPAEDSDSSVRTMDCSLSDDYCLNNGMLDKGSCKCICTWPWSGVDCGLFEGSESIFSGVVVLLLTVTFSLSCICSCFVNKTVQTEGPGGIGGIQSNGRSLAFVMSVQLYGLLAGLDAEGIPDSFKTLCNHLNWFNLQFQTPWGWAEGESTVSSNTRLLLGSETVVSTTARVRCLQCLFWWGTVLFSLLILHLFTVWFFWFELYKPLRRFSRIRIPVTLRFPSGEFLILILAYTAISGWAVQGLGEISSSELWVPIVMVVIIGVYTLPMMVFPAIAFTVMSFTGPLRVYNMSISLTYLFTKIVWFARPRGLLVDQGVVIPYMRFVNDADDVINTTAMWAGPLMLQRALEPLFFYWHIPFWLSSEFLFRILVSAGVGWIRFGEIKLVGAAFLFAVFLIHFVVTLLMRPFMSMRDNVAEIFLAFNDCGIAGLLAIGLTFGSSVTVVIEYPLMFFLVLGLSIRIVLEWLTFAWKFAMLPLYFHENFWLLLDMDSEEDFERLRERLEVMEEHSKNTFFQRSVRKLIANWKSASIQDNDLMHSSDEGLTDMEIKKKRKLRAEAKKREDKRLKKLKKKQKKEEKARRKLEKKLGTVATKSGKSNKTLAITNGEDGKPIGSIEDEGEDGKAVVSVEPEVEIIQPSPQVVLRMTVPPRMDDDTTSLYVKFTFSSEAKYILRNDIKAYMYTVNVAKALDAQKYKCKIDMVEVYPKDSGNITVVFEISGHDVLRVFLLTWITLLSKNLIDELGFPVRRLKLQGISRPPDLHIQIGVAVDVEMLMESVTMQEDLIDDLLLVLYGENSSQSGDQMPQIDKIRSFPGEKNCSNVSMTIPGVTPAVFESLMNPARIAKYLHNYHPSYHLGVGGFLSPKVPYIKIVGIAYNGEQDMTDFLVVRRGMRRFKSLKKKSRSSRRKASASVADEAEDALEQELQRVQAETMVHQLEYLEDDGPTQESNDFVSKEEQRKQLELFEKEKEERLRRMEEAMEKIELEHDAGDRRRSMYARTKKAKIKAAPTNKMEIYAKTSRDRVYDEGILGMGDVTSSESEEDDMRRMQARRVKKEVFGPPQYAGIPDEHAIEQQKSFSYADYVDFRKKQEAKVDETFEEKDDKEQIAHMQKRMKELERQAQRDHESKQGYGRDRAVREAKKELRMLQKRAKKMEKERIKKAMNRLGDEEIEGPQHVEEEVVRKSSRLHPVVKFEDEEEDLIFADTTQHR